MGGGGARAKVLGKMMNTQLIFKGFWVILSGTDNLENIQRKIE
jgi:hypothetical protein